MSINESEKTLQDDALIMVHLRNDFYKRKFRWVLIVYILSLVMIVFLLGVLNHLVKNSAHPKYFVTDDVGRLIYDVPRKTPGISTDEAASWATEAVETAYTYNFVNFRSQLQMAQKYFTDYGWRNYMDGLRASNNLIALEQKKFVIIAKAVAKPKLLVEGILGSGYAWKFQIPLLVTYMSPPYDGKSQFQNPLLVTVVVQRQSILTSYKGLGVMQMIGDLVMNPSVSTMSAPPT